VVSGLGDARPARTAVVTGASAGIGRAIAVALGGLGWSVGLGARRTDRLEETAHLVEVAGGRPFASALDVGDAASIDAFLEAVRAELGPVEVLVNNAGVAAPGRLHEMSDAQHAQILATVNPRPVLGTYGVSKAGLEAYATVLALECEDFPIRSSIVRVGPTITGFADGWEMEQFTEIIASWQRFGIQRHFNTMHADDVARAVVAVVTAPPHMWTRLIEVQPLPPTI
jgi:NADP-dependent 3-hydroxy acid dehydrogenase YdfG